MKFIISVTVHGDSVYDIEADSEKEARNEAQKKALAEFSGAEKQVAVLSVHLLCPSCKKAMWSESNFCQHCGTRRPGKEVAENGNLLRK